MIRAPHDNQPQPLLEAWATRLYAPGQWPGPRTAQVLPMRPFAAAREQLHRSGRCDQQPLAFRAIHGELAEGRTGMRIAGDIQRSRVSLAPAPGPGSAA